MPLSSLTDRWLSSTSRLQVTPLAKQFWKGPKVGWCSNTVCPVYFIFFFNFLFYTGAQLIDNVVLESGVQQSDSVIHTRASILFQIIFPFSLLQNIEQHSLCYRVGPCWLTVLNIACVHVNPNPQSCLSPTHPPGNHKFSSLSLWVCVCFLNKFFFFFFFFEPWSLDQYVYPLQTEDHNEWLISCNG